MDARDFDQLVTNELQHLDQSYPPVTNSLLCNWTGEPSLPAWPEPGYTSTYPGGDLASTYAYNPDLSAFSTGGCASLKGDARESYDAQFQYEPDAQATIGFPSNFMISPLPLGQSYYQTSNSYDVQKLNQRASTQGNNATEAEYPISGPMGLAPSRNSAMHKGRSRRSPYSCE
jgi:hypothetical protein